MSCVSSPTMKLLSSLARGEVHTSMEGASNGCRDKKVLIREIDEDRDLEVVEKLERSCEIGSRRGYSILTNMMGDPLCRVRLYSVHVMLVAELVRDGSIVGMVRGCMKCMATGLGSETVRMGCILGLRVSPKHRRNGIGSELIKSAENWAIRNGAQFIFLAIEENNVASINLFTLKFDYTKLNSLAIVVQSIEPRAKINPLHNIYIQKLSIEQAITLYKDKLGGKRFFPADMDAILKEQLCLGTWVSYFKEEQWSGLHSEDGEFSSRSPSSWAIVSMWKTYESYKLQVSGAPMVRCFYATLGRIGKVLPCLKPPQFCELLSKPFGFIFLFGIYGEGERVGELISSLWCFASHLAGKMSECKAIVAEFGETDALKEHVPQASNSSQINDLWFLKRVGRIANDWDDLITSASQPLSQVFVDPRDF